MLHRFYTIKSNPAIGGCVYKLYYDKKYIIVKAKNMDQSVGMIQKMLNQFIRGSENKKEGLWYHFFKCIKEMPGKEFSTEVLIESESAYTLLKEEQLALDDCRRDQDCLNNNTEAYIPQYNEEKRSHGWIPVADYLNFQRWIVKRRPTKHYKLML